MATFGERVVAAWYGPGEFRGPKLALAALIDRMMAEEQSKPKVRRWWCAPNQPGWEWDGKKMWVILGEKWSGERIDSIHRPDALLGNGIRELAPEENAEVERQLDEEKNAKPSWPTTEDGWDAWFDRHLVKRPQDNRKRRLWYAETAEARAAYLAWHRGQHGRGE